MGQKELIFTLENGVRTIQFNRPEKKNAINIKMYKAITSTLNADAVNDAVVVTIITGTGEYYSSGNDIKGALDALSNGSEERPGTSIVKDMVDAIINYPKILIAVVNGPAIGIGSTMSALCDIIYASDRATFDTPFIRMGLCAEGCSSFMFPHILGRSKASEMLLLNHKLTAQEAYNFGFVARVIKHENLNDFIKELKKFGKLPVTSVKINKGLILANYKKTLLECNERETKALEERIQSEEFAEAIVKFMSRSSKL